MYDRVYVERLGVDENTALREPSGTNSLNRSVDNQSVETMAHTKRFLRLLVLMTSQCQTMRSLYVILGTNNNKTEVVNHGGS